MAVWRVGEGGGEGGGGREGANESLMSSTQIGRIIMDWSYCILPFMYIINDTGIIVFFCCSVGLVSRSTPSRTGKLSLPSCTFLMIVTIRFCTPVPVILLSCAAVV